MGVNGSVGECMKEYRMVRKTYGTGMKGVCDCI